MTSRTAKPLFVTVVALLVAGSVVQTMATLTRQRIARNEQAWFEVQLNALIPKTNYDNDLLTDQIGVKALDSLGSKEALPVYRARKNGKPVALVITSVAPDGYGGPIKLLVGIRYDGTLLGVRILSHHETPNMGNDFELPDSHWLDSFVGRSLNNPEPRGWNVRKDGGEFEQFTSATITPRAIVHAVQRTLDYYHNHRDELFNQPHEYVR